ncbi:uncharacterized protein LOC108624515 [Ceratina calcarata]|uniref:Uncharacterized protein LOC108624515 n=1 Tax=Ceratina calcarata TaxID=156304 RepID=A0AAJ7IY35_9HYME|nr:uncharacterized protein LOC108624515 [Ceratina calcarata]
MGRKNRGKGRPSRRENSARNVEIEERRNKEDVIDEKKREVPIEVRSRLSYPLISTLSRSEDEEGEIQLNIKPRFVFVSSLCALCSEKSKLCCEKCEMVSYCSKRHQAQGLREHRGLCEALAEIHSSIVSTISSKLDPEQYRVFRLRLLAIFESRIGRSLELWEREIVLYPRVCRICRRFVEKLVCCPRCGMESFCENHGEEHENWCEQFQIFQRFLFLQRKHGRVEPWIPNVHRSMSVGTSYFDELMCEIYGDSSYYRQMDCYTYCLLSHLSTIPLTALYTMQISCDDWQTKIEYTIHVIGAEFQFEGINLYVWEKLFLHLSANLKTLRLIFIGPELHLPRDVPPKLLSTVNLCQRCKSDNRAIVVSFKPEKLYHDVIHDSTSIAEPDLICAFNPGLYRKTGFGGRDTWFETIREFCGKLKPVAITSYTADEMVWEMARIGSVAEIDVILQPRLNPYASIKPDRNFVSDDTNPLIYKNFHIAIVKGKTISSSPVNEQ